MEELTRKQVRYICFRLQTEKVGGAKASPTDSAVMSYVEEIKAHMESQIGFDGWENFTVTWDVGEKAYFVVRLLKRSAESVWNDVLEKEARDLPLVTNGTTGISYMVTESSSTPPKKTRKRKDD